MPELSVNRTLVKSPPELWPEFSEVERLANHLGEFGEITISRLEPEHTVAWVGERACGTVELEASGPGTKVTLRAQVLEVEADRAPAPGPAEQPETPLPSPTIYRVIPDLEAWDRSAAEIESHARRPTAASQRAAERAAERALRERKGGLARRLFRGGRTEPDVSADNLQPPPAEAANGGAPAVDEEHARAVLEAALDNLGAARRRRFSRA